MYRQPQVYSSYQKNNLGKVLYKTVLKYKPKKIIDFGVLHGYSTIAMAQGLKDMGRVGHITGYDLWQDYPYRHTTKAEAQKNLKKYKVEDFVTLKKKDFYKWIKKPEEFDLLHLDISNTGDIIDTVVKALKKYIDKGSILIFEGGIPSRDRVTWMVKYKRKPIYPFKRRLGYKILTKKFPGISIIKK